MNMFKKLWLTLRMLRRLGAFIHARKQGMSIEEARAHSDSLYPPTREEAAYEQHLRREELSKEIVGAAQKLAASDQIDFRSLSPERQMEYVERAAQALGVRLESN